MLLESEELATKELASAKAADDRQRGTLAATTLSEPATAADNRRCALANYRPLQTVCRRARPCRRTGRLNCPRAPSPIDEALPSPQPTGGGDFTFGLNSPDIVGVGLGGGKLSFSIGDALSFAPHDGVIFSLLQTL